MSSLIVGVPNTLLASPALVSFRNPNLLVWPKSGSGWDSLWINIIKYFKSILPCYALSCIPFILIFPSYSEQCICWYMRVLLCQILWQSQLIVLIISIIFLLYRHYFGLRACVLHGFNVQDLFHLVWNDFKSFTESEISGVDSRRSPVIISVFLFSGFKVTVSESIKLLYFGWFFYLSVVGKYHFLCSVSHVFRGNSKCEFRALSLLRYLISIISCFPNWFSINLRLYIYL